MTELILIILASYFKSGFIPDIVFPALALTVVFGLIINKILGLYGYRLF